MSRSTPSLSTTLLMEVQITAVSARFHLEKKGMCAQAIKCHDLKGIIGNQLKNQNTGGRVMFTGTLPH